MKYIFLSMLCGLCFSASIEAFIFIPDREQLNPYLKFQDVILVASTGHSGSTMLSTAVERFMPTHKVLKTHILPPSRIFSGKILFIFSNPDCASESVLHKSLRNDKFGLHHFYHMESSDHHWLEQIGWDTRNQTSKMNLLAYDALGVWIQLEEWLHHQTIPCIPSKANILAVKLEDLWRPETIKAIRGFLETPDFTPPPQKKRGYKENELLPEERLFRELYNLGTFENPIYSAYDRARDLWEIAPPYQFLRVR